MLLPMMYGIFGERIIFAVLLLSTKWQVVMAHFLYLRLFNAHAQGLLVSAEYVNTVFCLLFLDYSKAQRI